VGSSQKKDKLASRFESAETKNFDRDGAGIRGGGANGERNFLGREPYSDRRGGKESVSPPAVTAQKDKSEEGKKVEKLRRRQEGEGFDRTL